MSDLKETWPIEKLKNWDKNPRSIKESDFERLKAQIKKLGVYKPLLIDSEGTVLGGNMRLRALKALGATNVWVSVVNATTDAERLEYALSDNDRAGNYDDQMLAELLQNTEIDMNLYKVDLGDAIDLEKMMQEFGPDPIEDEVPEVQDNQISKLGEVYQLGRHRLMCGDSTKLEDVEKLMNGTKADICFTSPPYNVGHNLGYERKDKYNGNGDNMPDYDKFLINWTDLALDYCKYVFCNIQMLANNKNDVIRYLYAMNDFICDVAFWKKSQVAPAMAEKVMNSQVEFIWIFSKENNSRAISTGSFRGNVSNFIETSSAQKDNENSKIHNATIPLALCEWVLKNFTDDDEIVLDLFAGSGSTLIACEQTNRICYTMELDCKYVDVIRKRYAKFIGREDWIEATPASSG